MKLLGTIKIEKENYSNEVVQLIKFVSENGGSVKDVSFSSPQTRAFCINSGLLALKKVDGALKSSFFITNKAKEWLRLHFYESWNPFPHTVKLISDVEYLSRSR